MLNHRQAQCKLAHSHLSAWNRATWERQQLELACESGMSALERWNDAKTHEREAVLIFLKAAAGGES
jgi:hypothetical protein